MNTEKLEAMYCAVYDTARYLLSVLWCEQEDRVEEIRKLIEQQIDAGRNTEEAIICAVAEIVV